MDLGPYRIEGELGRGGMGCVYRALAPDGRRVAVKVLLRPGARDALERFRREARLQGALGLEDGFVPLLDGGEGRSGPFVVMPLLEGGTLRGRLQRGALSLDEALRVGVALGRALSVAHARGLVHRDLKPENVLFTADGRPLVSDLGLAKHFAVDAHTAQLSKTGELRGTVGYAAPEQLKDAKSVGPPADVFALGVIVYEALAGASPFEGETALERMAAIVAGELVPLRTRRRDVPAAVARVVERALARAPGDRWPDGGAFAAALEAAARAPAGVTGRGWWSAASGAAVLAASLVVGLALAVTRFAGPSTSTARVVTEAPSPPSPPSLEVAPVVEPFPAETRTLRRARVIGAPTWKMHDDVHAAAPLPGGERALLAGGDGSVALLDLARGELLWTAWTDGPVYAAAVTRDGRRGATGGKLEEVRLWDLAEGHDAGRLALPSSVTSLAFSADGKRLAAVGVDGLCRVLDVATGRIVHEVLAGPAGGGVVAWSPDGARLVTGGRDGMLRIYRGEPPDLATQWQAHEGVVMALRHADGADVVVSGGWDGSVAVWDVERRGRDVTYRQRARFAGHTAHVRTVAVTPDARRVVSGGADDTLRVWDVAQGAEVRSFRGVSYFAAVGLSADAGRVWGLCWRDDRLRVWDVDGGGALDAPRGHLAPISGVALLPGGRALSGSRDATLRVWDLASGAEVRRLEHPDGVFAFAVSADAKRAQSGGASGTVCLWDLETGARVDRFGERDGWALAAAFSREGKLIATGSSSGAVRVRATGDLAPLDLPGHRGDVTAAVFAPDMTLITGGADGAVHVWDLTSTAGHRDVVSAGGPTVRGLALTGDRRLLVAADDGTLAVWSLETTRRLLGLRHPRSVRGVAVTPDGARAASACWDGAVRLWDLGSGEEVDRIDLSPAHDRPNAVAISADGREVLVGTSRGVVLHYVAR